jgi:hypothetical protein
MHNIALLEENYKKFISNLAFWAPESLYVVNLNLLYDLNLLHFQPFTEKRDPNLTRYFHIIEASEKITLVNDEFIVWIKPDRLEERAITYTLIALNKGDQEPHLELVFLASGIYNTSRLVLRILEKFLIDVQETEVLLSKLEPVV